MIPGDIMRFHMLHLFVRPLVSRIGSRKTHQNIVKHSAAGTLRSMPVSLQGGNMCGSTGVAPCSTLGHLHGSMAAWQVLGGPYWICRSRSGGFWGKTKVLRISRLWLVQTASGSSGKPHVLKTFEFKMVQGIYPSVSKLLHSLSLWDAVSLKG